MPRDIRGKYHGLKRAEAHEKLFKHCKLLEPLRALKDIAELVLIRGDMAQVYADDLTTVLSSTNQSAPIRKQHSETKKVREGQPRAPSFQDFMAELAEKHKDDLSEKEMVELAQQCTMMPAKSPAVMAELMKPPTKAEWERVREHSAVRYVQAAEADTTDDDTEDGDALLASDGQAGAPGAGGIGLLGGKPVLGPPRPPRME